MKILQLSDIHACDENEELLSRVCDSIINALKGYPDGAVEPDVLLITGDYTHTGSLEEYALFRRVFYHKMKNSVLKNTRYTILIPGNHDYPWTKTSGNKEDNYIEFEKELSKTSKIDDPELLAKMEGHCISHLYEEDTNFRVLLVGMNSMKIDSLERPGIGYFDMDQLQLISDIIKYYRAKTHIPMYTFVAFHHHLLPVNFIERDTLEDKDKYSLTLDARRAIDFFLNAGVQFALHGHQHQPSMVTYSDDSGEHDNQKLHIISCGCLADEKRLNDSGRRSFLLYDISEGKVVLHMAETARGDADTFIWQEPIIYNMNEYSLPKIDRKRIRDWAEKDNRWVNQVDDVDIDDNIAEHVSITEMVEMLVDGITDDGSVAYYAGKRERYRTSTLATVLECMSDINLLPQEDIEVMQQKLMRLRDSKSEFLVVDPIIDDIIDKAPEDEPAWGLDEAPSVWTTSKALTALFHTHYLPKTADDEKKILDSVYWLVKQQYSSGGWGYQNYNSEPCEASIPMTALALRAISLSLDYPYIKNSDDVRKIYNAIKKGAQRLMNNQCRNKGEVIWKYKDKPNLSVSIWSIQALDKAEVALRSSTEFNKAGIRIGQWQRKYENEVIEYVIHNLPYQDNSSAISETFFFAAAGSNLKYKPKIKKGKEFKSFTPYVLSYILTLNPEYATKNEVKAMIKWVLRHKDTKWLIEDFNGGSEAPCMISIAMAISVIVRWLQETSNRALNQEIKEFFVD